MDSLFKLLLCLRMAIFSVLSSVKRKEIGLSCVCVCVCVWRGGEAVADFL
jgi:hypothetical protein